MQHSTGIKLFSLAALVRPVASASTPSQLPLNANLMPPRLKAEEMPAEPKAQSTPSWDLLWKILLGVIAGALAVGSFKGTTSTSVDGLTGKIEELKSQIASMQTNNTTQYQNMSSKVDSLSNQVNSTSLINGERIKGVEDSVTDIKSQIADIKAQFRSK